MFFRRLDSVKYKIIRFIESNYQLNLLIYNNIRFLKFLLPHEKDFYGMLLLCKKKKENVILDIGASLGISSLGFRQLGFHNKIYAFEPNKKNFLNLKENCLLNNLNIKLYNFGLSNSNYDSEIWYTDKDKMGGSAIFDKNDPELKKYDPKIIIKEKISLKKLDDVLEINNSNILVKIDVERHEKKVLEGMEKIIQQNKIIMQIEIGEENKKEVFDYLKKLKLKWINSIRHDHFFEKDI